jgi:hypothetical protein
MSFSTIWEALAAIFKSGNVASKFERDLAPQGVKFEDLHAELKPSSERSSESLNLIFSSIFYGFYVLFYCF